jgi:DDE superfamily endonuclease
VASRLYRTTRPLYLQVTRVLDRLGIAAGSPTTAALIALYVTGLILLDARPTQTRLARFLPGRCHDALNRLLRATPWSTRVLLGLLVAGSAAAAGLGMCAWTMWWSRRPSPSGCGGPAGPTRSPSTARSTACTSWCLLWCSADGRFRIPVAFRLWRPKRSCAPHRYQTKLELAVGMLTELVAARLPFQYLVADTRYTAGWFTRLAGQLRLTWVGTLPPKTTVVWHGRRQPAADLAARLRLRWRRRLGLRAAAVTAYAPRTARSGWW